MLTLLCSVMLVRDFAVCTETVFWTLNRLVPIEVHYILECFHQKP